MPGTTGGLWDLLATNATGLLDSLVMLVCVCVTLLMSCGPSQRAEGRRGVVAVAALCALHSCAALVLAGTVGAGRLDYVTTIVLVLASSALFSLLACGGRHAVRVVSIVSLVFSLVTVRGMVSLWSNRLGLSALLGDWETAAAFAIEYLAFVGVTVFFCRNRLSPAGPLPLSYWVLMVAIPTVAATISQVQMATSSYQDAYSLGSALLQILVLVTILGTYYLSHLLIDAHNSLVEQRVIAQRIDLEARHLERSAATAERVRREKHEIKNIFFYVRMLLDARAYDELDGFVDEEIRQFEVMEEWRTGNDVLDKLLSLKVGEARADGIHVMVDVLVPARLGVDDRDLIGLLANLLDNAIEASRAELAAGKEADIHVSVTTVKGYLDVRVRNRTSQNVLVRNPRLRTTKAHAEEHGVGMTIVRDVVRRNNGVLDVTMRDGYFVVDALLELRA